MKYIYSLVILFLVIILGACANVSTPTGGDKDETPPKLLTSIPENGQTNFQGQILQLTFDEWVTTQNIETDIIITPRIQASFRTRVKKNVLELSFYEPFNENTTYSLAFGKTIKDVTNNNGVENLTLSFSTGDYIDSLSISGNIKNLLDQYPIDGTLVTLYNSKDTTDILNGIASFYTNTDSLGNYQFNNLPPDTYKVYAVRDKNQNNKADSKNEKYGFFPDTIRLESNIENIDFTIQNLNTTELRRSTARHFGNYFEITFSKAITEFDILSEGQYYYHELTADKIRFYRYQQTYNDTIPLIYQAKDSLNTIYQDTVSLYFNESKIDKSSFILAPVPDRATVEPGATLRFQFSKPILAYNLDSMQIALDSTNVITLKDSLFEFNGYKTELDTKIKLSDLFRSRKSTIKLSLKKGAFISADNDTSKLYEKDLTLIEEEETATITGQIITSSNNIIVQLINATNGRVLKESFDKSYSFNYLPAGRYMIRVVNDLNANRKLDIGNILTNEVPEPIHYYFDNYYQTKIIEVRKNWQSTANISF